MSECIPVYFYFHILEAYWYDCIASMLFRMHEYLFMSFNFLFYTHICTYICNANVLHSVCLVISHIQKYLRTICIEIFKTCCTQISWKLAVLNHVCVKLYIINVLRKGYEQVVFLNFADHQILVSITSLSYLAILKL